MPTLLWYKLHGLTMDCQMMDKLIWRQDVFQFFLMTSVDFWIYAFDAEKRRFVVISIENFVGVQNSGWIPLISESFKRWARLWDFRTRLELPFLILKSFAIMRVTCRYPPKMHYSNEVACPEFYLRGSLRKSLLHRFRSFAFLEIYFLDDWEVGGDGIIIRIASRRRMSPFRVIICCVLNLSGEVGSASYSKKRVSFFEKGENQRSTNELKLEDSVEDELVLSTECISFNATIVSQENPSRELKGTRGSGFKIDRLQKLELSTVHKVFSDTMVQEIEVPPYSSVMKVGVSSEERDFLDGIWHMINAWPSSASVAVTNLRNIHME
ncbi:hypothetical protein Tco_0690049 [Tanacetum coccineum]